MDATELEFYDFWLRLTTLLTLVVLVLSWTGIYAVMSFTVSRRTREIGIRVALGASARSVVLAIFRRPLMQVTMGVALGAAVILALRVGLSAPGRGPSAGAIALMVAYAVAMLWVCLLACVVPTRPALRIEPMAALRALPECKRLGRRHPEVDGPSAFVGAPDENARHGQYRTLVDTKKDSQQVEPKNATSVVATPAPARTN